MARKYKITGWQGLVALGATVVAGIGMIVAFVSAPAGAAISTSQVQWDLAGLGYLSLSGIDGVQGPVTIAAVRSFQSNRCLSVDGSVGPQTEGALTAVVEQVQRTAGSPADGAYGPNTKAAVVSWQSGHGLSADGIAGPDTMAAMGIARTVNCGAPAPSGSGGTPAPTASATTQLQWDLAGLGYLTWSGIDGSYGPITTAAVRSFQSNRCLSVDGSAGPQTNGALIAVVQAVQKVAGTSVDGSYGPNTKAAVTSWQSGHGLSADGIAGPQTMAAMGIARTVSCGAPTPPKPAPSAPPAPPAPPAGNSTPAPGSSAAATLQWDLAGLGYLPLSGIDGSVGPQTEAATRGFQSDRCLSVDGSAGPQTNGALATVIKAVQKVAGTTADGSYGPNTKSAVATWQSKNGLTSDGIAGPQTMAKMGIARTVKCAAPPPPPTSPPPSGGGSGGTVRGMDVSSYQGSINWAGAYADGARFVYIKATEGTTYVSSSFTAQYNGSYSAGFIRGAYHFAHPNVSTGAAQADFFIAHGGGWSADGRTLPGALDIEFNPSGSTCYGLSQASMRSWVQSFVDEYHAREGVYPVIYSATSWWDECVGASNFGNTDPLWLARYASSAGAVPSGWGFYTIWQNADAGTFPGDQDIFNGGASQLKAVACAGKC